MEKIYELWFVTADGAEHNLLYKLQKDAEKDLYGLFRVGNKTNGKEIINASVFPRILF